MKYAYAITSVAEMNHKEPYNYTNDIFYKRGVHAVTVSKITKSFLNALGNTFPFPRVFESVLEH